MDATALRTVRTTCPYCGVGCGIVADVAANGTVTVRGDKDHPANLGRLCSKGSALDETLGKDGRLLEPRIGGRRATWDTALDLVAGRFSQAIAEHGPDAVAFYVSGQLLTEDYYVANKLMKGFIGSANIDTNSRLCMASSVAGHRRAFGSDTVPGAYEDLEEADLVVMVGSNLAWCHPVLFQRLLAAREERPHMCIVAVDPRRTVTAEQADLHLPIAPDTDTVLFNGLLAAIAGSDAVDRAYVAHHTTGFDRALAEAASLSPAAIAARTGLTPAAIEEFFARFVATERTVTIFSQGVNQSVGGTDKVNAIINCHLATGRIGRPGMGPFSVTGQPNAMGGREAGGLANQLACHMELADPAHRAIVKAFWNAPVVAEREGLKAVDLFDAVADGHIKALWIMATNPADSMPDAARVESAIAACPFVVVSDVEAVTDTARHAHVLLPATAWGEKDGTVTNSERRISRQRSFLAPPGEARPDWWIVSQVARRMGFARAFDYVSPAQIFREYAALSAHCNNGTRDFDIGGLAELADADYARLAPVRWPVPRDGHMDAGGRFFAKGGFFTADRRARFVAVTGLPTDRTDPAFPLVLNTGRVRDHWHTMTRTARSTRLSTHIAEPFVEIHPRDAAGAGIGAADLVVVESARAKVILRALVTDRQRPGAVFAPMHWTDQQSSPARIDTLVAPICDPLSGQPGLKLTPVRIARFEAAWFGFAVLERRPAAIGTDYWALARVKSGWRLELASTSAPDDWSELARRLADAPGPGVDVVTYSDEASGSRRFAVTEGGRIVGALFTARHPVAVARSWAAGALGATVTDLTTRYRILAGRAGGDRADPGAIVCSCFEVGVNQIVETVTSGRCATMDEVGRVLRAGTNCGSCRGEIAGLIASAALARAG